MSEDAEDEKLIVLARSAASRGNGVGAAVRDDIGRTYLAGSVALASLRLSAVQAALAAAVSSGATVFEAVAIVGGELSDDDADLLTQIGSPRVLRE